MEMSVFKALVIPMALPKLLETLGSKVRELTGALMKLQGLGFF
jgi:hypothetical protein